MYIALRSKEQIGIEKLWWRFAKPEVAFEAGVHDHLKPERRLRSSTGMMIPRSSTRKAARLMLGL